MPHRKVRWRKRTKDKKKDSRWWDNIDVPDFFDCDLGTVVVVLVGTIALGLLAWFFVIPLLLLVLDLVIVIVLAVVGVIARVVLHRPWEIEAIGPDGRLSWRVVGWRRSSALIKDVENDLLHGVVPSTDPHRFGG